MAHRKVPETDVPMMPVHRCSEEVLFRTVPLRARMPRLSSTARMNTIEEWPSENQKPVVRGRFPSWMSLRVVLSMAAM